MATWKNSKSLEDLAARTVVKNFMKANDPLIKVSCYLLKDEDIKSMFEKDLIPNIDAWWKGLQILCSSVRINLQKSLGELTEVNPNTWNGWHSCHFLFNFFLKIMTLEEVVFSGREYERPVLKSDFLNSFDEYEDESDPEDDEGDDDDCHHESDYHSDDDNPEATPTPREISSFNFHCSCSANENDNLHLFPEDLVNVIVALIKSCNKFPMKSLSIYGYLPLEISKAIIDNSPDLEAVSISDRSFSDKLFFHLGSKCSNLVKLYLPLIHGHNLSPQIITKGLFSNSELDEVKTAFETNSSLSVLFPNLVLFECGRKLLQQGLVSYEPLSSELTTWILHYHKNIYKFSIDMEKVFSSILAGENPFTLNLRRVVLNYEFLVELDPSKVEQLRNLVPNCESLVIYARPVEYTASNILKGESNLSCFITKSNFEQTLFVRNGTYESTKNFLHSTIAITGTNLYSITLYSVANHLETVLSPPNFNLDMIPSILRNCPLLVQLKLYFQTMYEIDFSDIQKDKFKISKNKLRELWFCETHPWEYDSYVQNYNEETPILWFKLLDAIQQSAPELELLSTTVWDFSSMSIILDKLSSNVRSFYLEHIDFRDEIIQCDQIIKLVKRFPNLRNLYLENLEGTLYWDLKCHFANSSLQIHWGNWGYWKGWPTTD